MVVVNANLSSMNAVFALSGGSLRISSSAVLLVSGGLSLDGSAAVAGPGTLVTQSNVTWNAGDLLLRDGLHWSHTSGAMVLQSSSNLATAGSPASTLALAGDGQLIVVSTVALPVALRLVGGAGAALASQATLTLKAGAVFASSGTVVFCTLVLNLPPDLHASEAAQ